MMKKLCKQANHVLLRPQFQKASIVLERRRLRSCKASYQGFKPGSLWPRNDDPTLNRFHCKQNSLWLWSYAASAGPKNTALTTLKTRTLYMGVDVYRICHWSNVYTKKRPGSSSSTICHTFWPALLHWDVWGVVMSTYLHFNSSFFFLFGVAESFGNNTTVRPKVKELGLKDQQRLITKLIFL